MNAEHHISYTTKGRYYTFGNLSKAKKLIIALHGHGQLAIYFLKKFHFLNPDDFFVVCPEGPNRYYLSGHNGRVGATWMTKEDRLTDIENYISFLNSIATYFNDFQHKSLLGFSQGGATASRFLAYGDHSFDQFILWATVFPPDMPVEYHKKFNQSECHFVFGTDDEFYSPEMVANHHQLLQENELNFTWHKFGGKHELNEEILKKILI